MSAGGPVHCSTCRTEKAIKSQTDISTREHETRMRELEQLIDIIQAQQSRVVSRQYHEPLRFLPENSSEEEKQEYKKMIAAMVERKKAADERDRILEQKYRVIELCVGAIVVIALYFLIF
jgi:hypothetical protein